MRFERISGHGDLPADALALEARALGSAADRELSDLFNGVADAVLVRAPARLDLMGGIADYSGSLVCEGPLAHAEDLDAFGIGDGVEKTLNLLVLNVQQHLPVLVEYFLCQLTVL